MHHDQPAVLFDLDGVLIDSADAHLQAWRTLAAELGHDVPAEKFLATFGQRNADVVPQMFGMDPDSVATREAGQRKELLYRDAVRGRVPRIPGAVELVHALAKAGIPMAVASSGPRENVELALTELGVDRLMVTVVTGDDVMRGKPDPMVFQLAAEGLGVGPRRCVVIEDSPAGIEAGLAAEMTVVGVATGHPRQALGRAHLVVDAMADLSVDLLLQTYCARVC